MKVLQSKMNDTKICVKCKKEKYINDFRQRFDRKKKSYYNTCKECDKKINIKYKI